MKKKKIIYGIISLTLVGSIVTTLSLKDKKTVADDIIQTEEEFIAESPFHDAVDKKTEKKLKDKVKKPKQFPDDFQIDTVHERISHLGDTMFEYTYVTKKNKIIIISVYPEAREANYSNDFGETPRTVTLKNGTEAIFFKNDSSVSLNWIDKDTNYEYNIHIMRDKQISRNELNKENASNDIKKLKLIAESIQ